MKEKTTVVILLLLIFFQALLSIKNKSVTFDEIAHLPAGYSYIRTLDFRMNIEHPPLVKQLSALPLLFLDLNFPVNQQAWNESRQWIFGWDFLYNNKLSADKILFLGRLPVILLSCLLGYFLFSWTKQLFGVGAGLFSLFLYTFSPNILAHSRLVTTDLGVSLFVFLSIYTFWKYLKSPRLLNAVLGGICFGLVIATKFSAILIFPIYFLVLVIFYMNEKKLYIKLWHIIAFFGAALLIVCLTYGFVSFNLYFRGLSRILSEVRERGHSAYLLGQYRSTGWLHYFLVAFILKTPIPSLIFVFMGLYFCRKHKGLYFLYIPIIIFFLFASFSKKQIGLRHILPIYPFLYIAAGTVFNYVRKRYREKLILAPIIFSAMCGWLVFSQIKIFPDYLAYFNELGGGSDNGYKYFVDSNLDWGQDLPGLKSFLNKEGNPSLIFSYFGTASRKHYDIKHQELLNSGMGLEKSSYINSVDVEKEYFAISATNLQAVYFRQKDIFRWLKERSPVKKIGYSIFVYDISKDIEATAIIGEIYRSMGWDEHAERQYKRILYITDDKNISLWATDKLKEIKK